MVQDNIKYLFKNGGVSFLFKILGVVFGFLVIYVISNFYNEKFYGTFALLQVILQALVIVSTLGLPNILVLEVNKYVSNKFAIQLYKKVLKIVLVTGVFPSVILVTFSDFISLYVFNKPHLSEGFFYIGLSLITFLFYEVTLYYFIATKKFVKFGLFMFVLPNLLFTVFLVLGKQYVDNQNQIFLIYSLAFLFSLILALLSVEWRLTSKSHHEIEIISLIKKSIPIMMSTFTMFLLNWIAVMLLGRFTDETSIGVYNAAFKLGLAVQLIMLTVNIIISPKIADLYYSQKYHQLKLFIHQSTRIITVLTLPIVMFVIIFKKHLLGFFGELYVSQGSWVLVVITITTFINAVTGNVDQILNMTGNQKSFFKIILVSLLVSIVSNIILIPQYSIKGAAISALLSTIVMNILSLIMIKKKLGYFTLF